MATLQHLLSGRTIQLRSHHTFGRHHASVDTRVENADVSHIHASIRWDGARWHLFDLSRNGTWIAQQRVPYGQSVPLCEGQAIRFGCAEHSAWRVVDLQAPKTMLVPLHAGGHVIEIDTFCGLPDDHNPQTSVYVAESGRWFYEHEGGVMALTDGDVIPQGNLLWTLHCAAPIDTTLDVTDQPGLSMRNTICRFDVSLDEEHIFLTLLRNGTALDLGERAHHYLLLTLARCRMHDQRQGIDLHEQGWRELDDLSRRLRLDSTHINTQIFRARQQMVKALPGLPYLPQLVERRVGSVRFGGLAFTITRGAEVEGCSAG